MGFSAGLRALGIAALGAVSIATVAAPTVAAADPSTTMSTMSVSTAATTVVQIAEQQRGKRYAFGASGPSAFDCSGLVRYAYTSAGVANRLGGGHSGYAMLAWARAHHKFSRSNPQVGDVVVYGNGSHVGVYIGNGRVISALNPSQGIRITALRALHQPLTGFIHTGLGQTAAKRVAVAAVRSKHTAAVTAKRSPSASIVHTRVYANLRSSASTAARVVTVVRPGTRLHVIGSTVIAGRHWFHVASMGLNGWVRADMVRAG